jgi:hypothetical protein
MTKVKGVSDGVLATPPAGGTYRRGASHEDVPIVVEPQSLAGHRCPTGDAGEESNL